MQKKAVEKIKIGPSQANLAAKETDHSFAFEP